MTDKALFRVAVLLSFAFSTGGALIGLFPGDLPDDWLAILEWHGDRGVMETLDSYIPASGLGRALWSIPLFGVLIVSIGVQIGLLMFWRPARFGFVILTGLYCALGVFNGLYVATPIEQALYDLSFVIDGAIIAMAYLSPIREQFETRSFLRNEN